MRKTHDLTYPADAMPAYWTSTPDSDYEFGLYLCDDGKPELWCLLAPGVPRYHYYPRHARGPKGQYPVKDGAVEVQRVADRNVYFLRLTWAQLGFAAPPKAGQDFALTCKWNADGGVAFGGYYAATKHAVEGWSDALAAEGKPLGIKVTALLAGGMRTPFILDRFPDTPLENLQDPRAVAETVRFLLGQPKDTVIPELMIVPMRETSWP